MVEPPNFKLTEHVSECKYRFRGWYCKKYNIPCEVWDICDDGEEGVKEDGIPEF